MGNICVPADEASKIDKEINDMLRKERKKLKEEIKLLLLGTHASFLRPISQNPGRTLYPFKAPYIVLIRAHARPEFHIYIAWLKMVRYWSSVRMYRHVALA